jgi:ribonuclease P protein component
MKFGIYQRIPSAIGFTHCLNSKVVVNKFYKVFYKNNQCGNARLGIIAAKKSMKRAVDRNRCKRMIREAFRIHPIKNVQIDLVILVRKASLNGFTAEIPELIDLFNKVETKCV